MRHLPGWVCPTPVPSFRVKVMEPLCHGCGNELRPGELYCPNCGRPQLRVDQNEVQAIVAERSTQPPAIGVDWRDAVRYALLLALPMGALCSVLAIGCVLWVVIGAMVAVALYLRKPRRLPLAANQGARIGMIAGLASTLLAALAEGLRLVITRYALGKGAEIDSDYLKQINDAATQMPQLVSSSPQSVAAMNSIHAFYLSAEGHATVELGTIAMGGFFLLLLSAIGGALGATVFRRRI